MIITLDWLRERGACESSIALFRERFGASVEITPDFDPALAASFDVGWLADIVLKGAALDAYNAKVKQARNAYDAEVKPALDAQDAALDDARAARDAELASARDAYDAKAKQANDLYNAKVKQARDACIASTRTILDAYNVECARAFLAILRKSGE